MSRNINISKESVERGFILKWRCLNVRGEWLITIDGLRQQPFYRNAADSWDPGLALWFEIFIVPRDTVYMIPKGAEYRKL